MHERRASDIPLTNGEPTLPEKKVSTVNVWNITKKSATNAFDEEADFNSEGNTRNSATFATNTIAKSLHRKRWSELDQCTNAVTDGLP